MASDSGEPRSRKWLRWLPAVGYAASQILVLLVLIVFENEILSDFDGLVESFLFIFLPAFLPSLVVGVLAGLSVFPTRMRWAVLGRIGATVLVVALGMWPPFLGVLPTLSFYESTPIALGQVLGAFVGMEAARSLVDHGVGGETSLPRQTASELTTRVVMPET